MADKTALFDKTILVIDDSEATCLFTARILSIHGYNPIIAHNGNDALEILAQQPIDIVISDVMMPGISGIDLCQHIKCNPKTASIPVILISGTLDPTLFSKCMQAGADGFLRKPFEVQELVQMIAQFD